ncbi:MAG: SGNH/GDSL hydrolase family protein [Alistipes sp.]|nr:SGNH/GDSL hydrolase family protein [Alistipes sp.]
MRQIVAFGDSIVRGIVLNNDIKPRYTQIDDSFVSLCSAQLGCEIKNYGRFGNTALRALHNLERYKEEIVRSEYAIIEFGGNDCDHHWAEIAASPSAEHHPLTTIPQYTEQVRQLIYSIEALGTEPILLSLPPIIADDYFNTFTASMCPEQRSNVMQWLNGRLENITQWHEMYNLALFKLASDIGVKIIDITSPFLVMRNYRELFCTDGIHPNRKGHSLIAKTICESLAVCC